MITVTLATQNAHKIEELNAMISQMGVADKLTLVLPESDTEIEETGLTFIENARLKATQTKPAKASHYIIADDSGIAVNTLANFNGLNPFPGVMSNRWLTEALATTILGKEIKEINQAVKNHALQTLLRTQRDRSGAYVCAMTVCDMSKHIRFETEGRSLLKIIEGNPRGENGFGYDPITVSTELTFNANQEKTFAELTMDEKNKISHRRKAFEAVVSFLLAQT